MQFAINTPNFGSFGDARILAELAREAEDGMASLCGITLEEVLNRLNRWPIRG